MQSSTSVRPGRGPTLVESSGSAIHTERGGATASVADHGSKVLSIIALVLASIALGAVLMIPSMQASRMEATAAQAALAERESRVSQERWNDIKVELARRGIPVSDH